MIAWITGIAGCMCLGICMWFDGDMCEFFIKLSLSLFVAAGLFAMPGAFSEFSDDNN